MPRFKGVKQGDVIEVETKSERGFAKVLRVTDDGVVYMPVANHFQRREHREHLKAHEIRGVYRHLKV